MKKILMFAAIAFGMIAMASCQCSNSNGATTELIYDVCATAEGEVSFSWFNGGADVNGYAKVFQCNDTTKVKGVVLTNSVKGDAVRLSDALVSNDAEVAEAAQEIEDMLTVNGVEGKYRLALKGYVKYGPMVFVIDEEYPKTAAVAEVE